MLEDEGTTVTSRQILGRLREGNSAGKESSAKSEEKASTLTSASRLLWKNRPTTRSARRSVACWLNTALTRQPSKVPAVGGRLTREDIDKHLAKAPAQAEAKAPVAAPAAQPALGARSENACQ